MIYALQLDPRGRHPDHEQHKERQELFHFRDRSSLPLSLIRVDREPAGLKEIQVVYDQSSQVHRKKMPRAAHLWAHRDLLAPQQPAIQFGQNR